VVVRPRRQIAWFWPALLLAGLAAVAAFRMWSGWATRPMVASDAAADGRVAGEASDLAAAGRRLRLLHARQTATAARLADLRTDIATRQHQTRTLEEMLAGGRLTDCPPFLRENTTVRALQKIIREAGGAAQTDTGRDPRLTTAAVVARERLRAKLLALRDQLDREAADLEAQATVLRQQQRLQETAADEMRRRIEEQLDGLSAGPNTPRVSGNDAAPAD
jgi:hypothetical protein